MTTYRELRELNNKACRLSRAKAKHQRADEGWLVGDGAGLSERERLEARRFLMDSPCTLSPAAKDALRKHLAAKRATVRDRIGVLLARLDAA